MRSKAMETTKQNTIPLVKVSVHAFEQYIKRVHKGNVSEVEKKHVAFWATEGIMNGKNLGKFPDGHTHYLYQGHTIVHANDNTLVTITPYNAFLDEDSGYGDVNQEIRTIVEKRLKKQLKPYESKKRALLIQTHENEIKRLRVHNPETQAIIAKRISSLKDEVTQINKKIQGIKGVAQNYQVEI